MSSPPLLSSAPRSLEQWQADLLGAEYDNMLSCVRCGLCLTSCPTYVLSMNETEGPRGRIAMMRALAEGHLEVSPQLVEHELNCLVCDACTAICPAGIHMDPMQVALRTALEPSVKRPPLGTKLRNVVFRGVFGDMRRFRRVARLFWLYQRSGLQWLARHSGVLRLLRLKRSEAFLPAVAGSFVVPKGEKLPAEGERTAEVSFFAGCVMSTALADVDRATVRVLQRSGADVCMTAGQQCCGALNAHGGDLPGAKELAQRNIAAFEADGSAPIVVNSAGCGAMLKDYAHHFRDDPEWAERAAAFSARVKDFSEFLAGKELPVKRELPVRATYQDACHLLHAQRISQQPRGLLKQIPGLSLCEIEEPGLCCGSAGIYNVTNPEQSTQLQARKVDHILDGGASLLVTANPGCLLQLRSGLAERGSDVQVKHLAEVLDEVTAP